MDTIDGFLVAVGLALTNAGQIVPWPLHVAQVSGFYSDREAEDLMSRFAALRATGTTDADLARLYPSTSSAKSLMLDLVPGMKEAGIARDDRVAFVTSILRGAAELETGDVFCRDGGHRLLTATQAAELLEAPGWHPADGSGRKAAVAAFGLSGAAQALVWSTHFYGWTDIAFVIHGPYPAVSGDGQSQVLIVRDFFDMPPGELWPELPEPPCRSLQIMALHDATERFTIDIFNHILHARPLLASCRAIRVVADGKDVAGAEIVPELRSEFVRMVRRQKAVLDGLTTREVLARFVESRYYAFRHWRVLAGDSWRPPAEVYARIAEWPIPPPPPDDDEAWEVLRKIFDPRDDAPIM